MQRLHLSPAWPDHSGRHAPRRYTTKSRLVSRPRSSRTLAAPS